MSAPEDDVDVVLRQARPSRDLEGLRALVGIRSRLFGRTVAEPSVGRYRLRERLGEGGLGVVHSAYDPELDREVAIKLVRNAMADDAAHEQARLLREGQAMARLSHPHVVEVFDVGTYEGAPELHGEGSGAPSRGVFIVMPRLEGETLEQWLRAEPRPWPEVLERFVAAGQGLAAAHAVGLVHRDFKPANVFVERDGRVRVLDFGLARGPGRGSSSLSTTSHELEDPRRSLTLEGMVLGTPAYMAPEQHRGGTVDARSDQYGFCAALYHGLHGVLPFRGADLEAIADQKHRLALVPPDHGARVPRWLYAVVLRGLAPDPSQRWPSMTSLLRALDRRPRRARRRALAIGTGLFGLGGLGWFCVPTAASQCGDRDPMATAWSSSSRAGVERGLGLHAAGRHALPHVLERLDAYTSAWRDEQRALCEEMLASPGDSDGDLRTSCLRRAAEHLEVLTRILAQADADVAGQASTAVAQLPALERCHDVELLRAELGPRGELVDDAGAEALRTGLAEISALVTAGRIDEALVEVVARVEDARALGHPPLLAETLWWEGHVRRIAGQLEPALPVLEEAAHLASAHAHDKVAALAAVELTTVLGAMARFDEALEWARHAEAAALRHGERRYPLARARVAEGTVLRLLGREEEAYQRYREALAVQQEADPGGHELPTILNNLGTAALGLGRSEEALEHYARSHERLAALLGDDHPQTAAARMNLGIVTAELGWHAAAQEHYAAAREAFVQRLGPRDLRVAYCDTNLGNLLLDLGRAPEARARYEAALDVFSAGLGPQHPNSAAARAGVGLAELRLGRPSQARQALERALTDMRDALGPEHPHVGVAMGQVGRALLAEGELAAARDQLEAAVVLLERIDAEPGLVEEARFHRARARWAAGDEAEAWSQVREIHAWFEVHGPSSARAEVGAWLAEHPRPALATPLRAP
ncbi:serine/threonine-protein kinase [Paraliomyxa miuraensis]|uniref:serine/threonine-protein kinase n=1 Tax=Paraliomyxa miuraensis TaxID=376150 RepID=UPI00225358BA|nr:serine/threonine-protein kinase [Paraliomyxa miuraensis]MCX4243275.1 serine/threonine-protein kinase [Paraliomyxa miuraensis]